MPKRSIEEKISDFLLLLYLIKKVNERGYVGGSVKLQKLTFLSEWEMIDERIKGFNYDFIRLKYGPYSPELAKDLDELVDEKLITGKKSISLTEHGEIILRKFRKILEKNPEIINIINKISQDLSEISGSKIANAVYNLEHPYRRPPIKIRDLSHGTRIIYRLSDEKAKIRFEIPESLLVTLETYLSSTGRRAMEEATESARKDPSLSFEEVFG